MNAINLELYRWKMHRIKVGSFKSNIGYPRSNWWMEEGAFVSVMPRQSGKTELLIRMAKMLQKEKEDFMFIVRSENAKNNILNRFPINPKLIEVVLTATLAFNFKGIVESVNHINLLVDEYTFINENAMRELTRMDWKSISMVGGLKL